MFLSTTFTNNTINNVSGASFNDQRCLITGLSYVLHFCSGKTEANFYELLLSRKLRKSCHFHIKHSPETIIFFSYLLIFFKFQISDARRWPVFVFFVVFSTLFL